MSKLSEIAAYHPLDIDEAVDGLRDAIEYFHKENDHRAIFARAYFLITLSVRQAVYQHGSYSNRMFFDVAWVKRLAGKFAWLYFESLSSDQRPGERAWKTAHRLAASRKSSVFQDMLLGLNAHINYDLAYGIYLNFKEFDDGRNHLLLPRRKFDHDQVNNILVDCIPSIENTLTRDYGGEVRLLSQLAGGLDEVLGEAGLKYYRERVWWSAVAFLSTTSDEEIGLVKARLDWESAQLAETIGLENTAWQRTVRRALNLFSKDDFGAIELESTEHVREKKKHEQATVPF
jgi:hypothetical protein